MSRELRLYEAFGHFLQVYRFRDVLLLDRKKRGQRTYKLHVLEHHDGQTITRALFPEDEWRTCQKMRHFLHGLVTARHLHSEGFLLH